jgi:NADH:ubiquinone oxidoreductase subunit 5 (subunit L)/multisubunit Na+/H+ antiporter MnhA subunit
MLISLFLVLRVFTSFYAGINSIFERDLKKLIALSTLRHLGFIGLAFSVGLLNLAFFHLLSHALFKSLLFMTMGDIIINLGHSQDIRFLSRGGLYTPFSCFIMFVSLFNLLGLPAMSGFFSKDLVLEALNYTSCRGIIYMLILFNLVFTFFYTYQLFFFSFQPNKLSAYALVHPSSFLHAGLLFRLAIGTLVFGGVFQLLICPTLLFPVVPLLVKFFPILLNFVFFISLLTLLSQFTPESSKSFLVSYFSSILFLYYFITKSSSLFYYFFCFEVVKSLELGVLHSSLNTKAYEFAASSRKLLVGLTSYSAQNVALILFSFTIFMLIV